MKNNIMLALLVSAFVSVQSFAQDAPAQDANRAERRGGMASMTPEQRAERQTAQMKKDLTLTAEQETTITALNLKFAQQQQKMMASGERNPEAMKQAMDARDAELKAVLTKDQFGQYEKMREEQRNRMREGRGPRNNRK
ncbi:hypothetical protein A6C57_19100 [Fibrella sp. ES10-3-2-2]|nr:hypothetical protein A6C57_19100 [Fibrella sp. ES10-3-2-2]